MQRPEIIKLLKNVLQQTAPEATAILYGSEARGDARSDSDIDIIILVNKDKLTLKEKQAITYPLYDIEFETGVIISPKVFSKKDWEKNLSITPFYFNVMREGVRL